MTFPFIAKSRIYLSALLFFLLLSCVTEEKKDAVNKAEEKAVTRLTRSVEIYKGIRKSPRSLDETGNTLLVPPSDWTSGFYPGCLWYAYEMTGDTLFRKAARIHTGVLENEKYNGTTHDIGFKMFCSYGNGYRLTHDAQYRQILLTSARTLTTRFNPVVGCIRSWDHHKELWQFPVIIDNMMNLELLFWAFQETGDSLYYKIAVSHADHTMKNHFRADYSSWHVVDYDTLTGNILCKCTHQGYADSSTWARGEAWGLYGFTMSYRYTKKPRYLQQAKHIAGYILQHLPADMVPYWDYDVPHIPDEPRDVSAAAITSSALYELSRYAGDSSGYYRQKAEGILLSLCSNYMLPDSSKSCFLLGHSTGSYPHHSEVDVPIIYADYYFLESLVRRNSPAFPRSDDTAVTLP